MKGISFEWDDNKAAINEAKHHITFSEASTVFADEMPFCLTIPIIHKRKKDL